VKTMMNKLAILAFALLSTSAIASEKIAVVDFDMAILGSEQAKAIIGNLKKQTEGEQAKIKKLTEEAQKLAKKLEQDSAVMSESEKRNLAKQIEDYKIDIQFEAQKIQKARKDTEQEMLRTLGPKFGKALEETLKEGDYSLVLNRKAIFFSKDGLDITRKVTEKLNLIK